MNILYFRMLILEELVFRVYNLFQHTNNLHFITSTVDGVTNYLNVNGGKVDIFENTELVSEFEDRDKQAILSTIAPMFSGISYTDKDVGLHPGVIGLSYTSDYYDISCTNSTLRVTGRELENQDVYIEIENLYLSEERNEQGTIVGPHEEESLQLGHIRCEHD